MDDGIGCSEDPDVFCTQLPGASSLCTVVTEEPVCSYSVVPLDSDVVPWLSDDIPTPALLAACGGIECRVDWWCVWS